MKMQKYNSLLLICALGVLASLEFGCGSIAGEVLHKSCIGSEKQALLLVKNSLIDNLNHLSSWVGHDCCAWHGIGCNNITNHVTQLELQNGDLSGRIPSGNQLQTLDDPSIYAGNDQLCGQPILKPCAGDTDSHNGDNHNEADTDFDSDDGHMWIFAGLGPGFSVGFLGFCAALRFSNIGIRTSILANKFLTR